ncbi:MAG TPA: hypothetical protein VG269_16420 [Tepidisphaeraceae bacterium]|nr:hypothetical protein [Tepidisphaeraceae bacterium]
MEEQPQHPNICEHLRPLLQYLLNQGAKITFAGQAWAHDCRVWVYFDGVLECEALHKRLSLPATVIIHDHRGTHAGAERGLVCQEHHDALIGIHPDYAAGSALPLNRFA